MLYVQCVYIGQEFIWGADAPHRLCDGWINNVLHIYAKKSAR